MAQSNPPPGTTQSGGFALFGRTVAQRLYFLVILLSAFMISIGVLELDGMNTLRGGLESVYKDRVVPLRDLKLIADKYAVEIVDASHKTRNGNLTVDQAIKSVTNAQVDIGKAWNGYLTTELVGEEKKLVAEIKPLMTTANAAIATLMEILRQKDMARLEAFTINNLYPAIDPLSEKISALVEVQLVVAKSQYDHASTRDESDRKIAIGAILMGLLLSFGTAYLIIRTLTRQLGGKPGAAADIANKIATGDLSTQITLRAGDAKSLMATMKSMQDNLPQVVGEIRGMVEAANKGDFNSRMNLESKQGYTKEPSELLNQLSGTVDTVFKDTVRVTQALAHGDLSQKVTRDYLGAYDDVKQAVNITADALTGIVGEIRDIVAAANRPPISTNPVSSISDPRGHSS